MLLTSLTLKDFRNQTAAFTFHPKLTVIVGENAQGKTNILESIYLVINGEGFRETKEEELIRFKAQDAQVEAKFSENGHDWHFAVHIKKQEEGVKKYHFINKTVKPAHVYKRAQTVSVLFSPEDIVLLSGPAEERRAYLDECIERFSATYRQKRKNYTEALKKRNRLLESARSIEAIQEDREFWDVYLEEHSRYLIAERAKYVEFINSHPNLDGKTFSAQYLPNPFTKELATETLEQDFRIRRTSIGPQKDELKVYLHDIDVHTYGSRSQQRLGVFWLKKAQLLYAQEQLDKPPILLLDDITSEFDEKNKELITRVIGNFQTIITTTEREFVAKLPQDKTVIEV